MSILNNQMLVTSNCWPLVAGYWLLAAGCLAAGCYCYCYCYCYLLIVGWQLLFIGYLSVGRWVLGVGC